MTFEVIEGGKGNQGNFVCPWCGRSFKYRKPGPQEEGSLEDHWEYSPLCRNNRNVNSQLQQKYNVIEDEPSEE